MTLQTVEQTDWLRRRLATKRRWAPAKTAARLLENLRDAGARDAILCGSERAFLRRLRRGPGGERHGDRVSSRRFALSVFSRGARRRERGGEEDGGEKTAIARAEDLIGGIVFGCCIAVGGADR